VRQGKVRLGLIDNNTNVSKQHKNFHGHEIVSNYLNNTHIKMSDVITL
jgi:hypothetical protein